MAKKSYAVQILVTFFLLAGDHSHSISLRDTIILAEIQVNAVQGPQVLRQAVSQLLVALREVSAVA